MLLTPGGLRHSDDASSIRKGIGLLILPDLAVRLITYHFGMCIVGERGIRLGVLLDGAAPAMFFLAGCGGGDQRNGGKQDCLFHDVLFVRDDKM